jgi:hypothetical protein
MTTNEYIRGIDAHGWERFNGKLWQRNYYEHIIRDEKELNKIRQYIVDNPLKWDSDENNPMNMNVGADQCVCPDGKITIAKFLTNKTGRTHRFAPTKFKINET